MLTEIVYEDEDVLVAHKPAGLATQTAKVGQQDVVSELRNYLSQSKDVKGASGNPGAQRGPYLGIIHRLDQPVEGLLVFAKSRQAAASLTRKLQEQGEEGTFCKHYYAVLCGIPESGEGQLSDYLCKQVVNERGHKEYKTVVKNFESGKAQGYSEDRHRKVSACPTASEYAGIQKAVLQYRILQPQEEQGLALADICIETGRFHQIRAQMAHAGMPLLGDMKYGDEEAKVKAQELGIRNVALCAYHLQFIHPVSKKKMDFKINPENPAFSFFSQF